MWKFSNFTKPWSRHKTQKVPLQITCTCTCIMHILFTIHYLLKNYGYCILKIYTEKHKFLLQLITAIAKEAQTFRSKHTRTHAARVLIAASRLSRNETWNFLTSNTRRTERRENEISAYVFTRNVDFGPPLRTETHPLTLFHITVQWTCTRTVRYMYRPRE